MFLSRKILGRQLDRIAMLGAAGGNAPPDGRKVKATLHWVAAANAVTAEVRVINQLFLSATPDTADFLADLNPDSLEVLTNAIVETAAAEAGGDEPMQFERQGYFRRDGSSSSGAPIFIRTVGLRDTFAKALVDETSRKPRG